jgi:uncharacterized protein (DUF1800 family)
MTMRMLLALFCGLVLVSCSGINAAPQGAPIAEADFRLIDRLTWGANATEIANFRRLGRDGWIEFQLRPAQPIALPSPVQAAIDAMPVAAQPMGQMVTEMEAVRYAAVHAANPEEKRRQYVPFQLAMKTSQADVQARSLLRDLYSADQLREQMTWFWFNHFSVRLGNQPLPLMVRDYVEDTIRPRALGKFCDLVNATLRHPAMLIYLNNAGNAAGKVNENYARELMELHTMGIGSGYTQNDVQQLAKVLSGAGVDLKTWPVGPAGPTPNGGYRDGLFVFDPARHVGGAKTLLGQTIEARGYPGISEATAILCRQPATARRIVTRIARYMVADAPPPALIDRMTATFQSTDGDITAVLRTMIASPEFTASLGTLYKDPQHYLLSALRLGFDGRLVSDSLWISQALARLGQPVYGRLTPDGYPLDASEWNSSGQLADRFGVAEEVAKGAPRLFTFAGIASRIGLSPDLKAISAATGIHARRAPAIESVLAEARNQTEWNALFLSSPEFMRR